jgi:hypothetical protein
MTQKYLTADSMLKPIYHPYKIKEGHSKLHRKMKFNTFAYVKKKLQTSPSDTPDLQLGQTYPKEMP